MILIMQNLGSKPKMSCNTITDVVIIIALLYLIHLSFTINNSRNLEDMNFFRPDLTLLDLVKEYHMQY